MTGFGVSQLMLHKALADATRKGSVLRNVAAVADPPSLSSAPRPEMKVWDAKQLRQFLQEISGHRLYPAFYLLSTTGMRRGGSRCHRRHFWRFRVPLRYLLAIG